MSNCSHCRCRRVTPERVTPEPLTSPEVQEPSMRRWPHSTASAAPAIDPSLHYIRCALSYQNQLLSEIRSLLEQLAQASSSSASQP